MQTLDERLRDRFATWSARGQGLALNTEPVTPEPAYVPFRGLAGEEEVADDGKRPTILSTFVRGLFSRNQMPAVPEPRELLPRPLVRGDLVEIELGFGADLDFSRDAYAYLLSSISVGREPVAFELHADGKGILVFIAAHPSDARRIIDQMGAFVPGVTFLMRDMALQRLWDEAVGEQYACVEYGLAREFVLPLARPKIDPYQALMPALACLEDGECAVFQVIFEPARMPWAASIMRASHADSGEIALADGYDIHAGAKQKISLPIYAATVRLLVRTHTPSKAESVAQDFSSGLLVLHTPGSNAIVPLSEEPYPDEYEIEDVICRQSRRTGMLLNSDELVSLVHIPSREVSSPKLRKQSDQSPAPPDIVTGDGLFIGLCPHGGATTPICLTSEQRLKHMHVIGASGTGKSTLLYQMLKADIETGRGVALIDPHGDLIDQILGTIPEERIKDVVLVDPSDTEHPVGLNILHAHTDLEKVLLASDLVSIFQRQSTSWGDQMGSVLNHAVLAFLESHWGGSLLDLRRFLLEPNFRAAFLRTVRDPEVLYYWQHGFPHLSGNKSLGPILTRLETFLSPKPIRCMVAQKESKLDFGDIIASGKIFLAKLSQGAIGRENSFLLGSLFVSKFQELAMARQNIPEDKRRDFFLYVDEFHNFITPSMAEILSGARKYRLGLVLAHQELRQLERDREVSSSVLSNTFTKVVFRVGDHDARSLAESFSHHTAKTLQNLGTGEAICRVERADYDFRLSVPMPGYPDARDADARRMQVIEASRARYGTPRKEIEWVLNAAAHGQMPAGDVPVQSEPLHSIPPRPVPEAPKVKVRPPEPAIPPTPGRGGKEHKYLQTFIKQWAEGMGWRSVIEASVQGGAVDVLLAKGDVSIACEISVTTSLEHEMGNLRKCVAHGFAHVVSISPDETKAQAIEKAAKATLPEGSLPRLKFFTPKQLFAFVEEIDAKTAASESTVKGYKVKVSYKALAEGEKTARTEQVANIVAKSLKRLGGKR